MTQTVRTIIIGSGGMARYHIRKMLEQRGTTTITAICEPSAGAYEAAVAVFKEAGVAAPPNQPDLKRALKEFSLDAAFIVTPHACHCAQTIACMRAGLDVLLEKPMVMNAVEARKLIRVRDKTRKLLVVAFPGSLSPEIREAVKRLRSGDVGKLISIDAVAWQNWGPVTVGTWRQQPELSGGGFLFDTGAHMLNTVVDLAGEEFADVAAWMDRCGRPVETLAVVIGRLHSGAMVTLHGCGESIPACSSDVRVFCEKAILRTGIWGQQLEIQKAGASAAEKVSMPASLGVWQQFMRVRSGKMQNPCPPEVGLRMAKLYDAIRKSAARGGKPVKCK